MNIFDILGPVMVGPSSSHTAGVVRIGNVVWKIFGEVPTYIKIGFFGSFAKTYVGHGSDKAIIAGILGFKTDDSRIKNSLAIAEKEGISFSFEKIHLEKAHPNTIVVEVNNEDDKYLCLQGESIGGGNIIIRKINNTTVDFNGQCDTIIISYFDVKGIISLVTNLLTLEQINIASMKVYRANKEGEALMIVETDQKLDKALGKTIMGLHYVKNATVLESIV